MDCLRDEIAYNINFAQAHLATFGVLVGMAVIAKGANRIVCDYDVHSAEEEKAQSDLIKGQVQILHADRLILLSIGERIDNRTSEKQDCIVVVVVTKVTTARIIVPFVKIGGEFIFGQEEIIKGKTYKEKIWHDLFRA